MSPRKISFLAFFILWARVQNWTVPDMHVRICQWLEHCDDPVRVLMVFRGAAKSTIFAVYKAWQLYCDGTWTSLIWSADGKLARKLSRDVINVLRRHPLTGGLLPPKPGAEMFWVNGATDARNASITSTGVEQTVTSARARSIDYDDVEVPKNIATPEKRENLRHKIQESTFILVPGGQETYIGTPHTSDSLYPETVSAGAALLKIPLFESAIRYEKTGERTRFPFSFLPAADGIYVISGIYKAARLYVEGEDYDVIGQEIVFREPPNATVLDIYGNCAWPERFDRDEIILRRRKTRTINYWDSQYMLEAKPITESRLDPELLRAYDLQPRIVQANNAVRMMLGNVQIVSGRARWDPAKGKVHGDNSAFCLVLDDALGNHYWHLAENLTGEMVEFSDGANTLITGGQVMQICKLVRQYNIVHITVETNGIGAFIPGVLQRALRQEGLECGVTPFDEGRNKNERILAGIEGPLSSGVLWAHVDVLDGDAWDEMQNWNPAVKEQIDGKLDSLAGCLLDAPVRIRKTVGIPTATRTHHWRQSAGTHEVALDI